MNPTATMTNYVLGLDVGDRRIGVALASAIARLPAPLRTLDRQKTDDVLVDISQLVAEYQVGVVVVGLPRGMSGQETEQTALTRDFAAELAKHLEIPVVMQDEAGTSLEAERLLKQRGKPYQKGDIDSEAAALILQDYLQHTAERSA